MNEIAGALRVVNTALKTVRIIDLTKKIIVVIAALVCCVFAFRFFRK